MRRTLPGIVALTAAVSAGLFLSACTVGDSGDAEYSSAHGASGAATSSGVDGVDRDAPGTLGLAVGDCVADLGADSGADSGAEEDATSSSAAASASATSAAGTTAGTSAAGAAGTTASAEPTEGTDTATDDLTAAAEADLGALDETVPESATGVTRVDCKEPHVGEVFAQQTLDNEVLFPGKKMDKLTAAVCTGDTFSDYAGIDYTLSALNVVSFAPSKESWAAGDRVVTCVMTDPFSGVITGSLKGAGY